jgi:hypothetical protein
MTQTPEPSPQPTSVAAAAPPAYTPVKPPRLYVAAAWVVIVAGIVFILSTVFFAGAMVVGLSHHWHCYKHHHGMMYGPGGPGGGPWQYGGGPGMVVGPWGPPPGFGPGGPGGPGQTPTPTAPPPAPNTPGNPRP